MIAVSITVVDRTRGRVIDATVSDTVPVAELVPHLVDATPGEHWRLSGPGGVLRPEHCLSEAGVRPGEQLTLDRATVPVPPADTVGRLTGDLPANPAVRVAALVTAAATVVLPPFATTPVWHPLEITDRARSVLDGAGDPGGAAATTLTLLALVAAVGCAAGGLHDRRFVAVARPWKRISSWRKVHSTCRSGSVKRIARQSAPKLSVQTRLSPFSVPLRMKFRISPSLTGPSLWRSFS